MKYRISLFLGIMLLVLSMASCQPQSSDTASTAGEEKTAAAIVPLVEAVLTKEQQDALTPEAVLSLLKGGNQRFINNELTARDHSAQVRKSVDGQFPKAVILSCLDSRVPVEDV